MESLNNSKQKPGEDTANKYEEELYNMLARLQSKRTRDGNNFLTGTSIDLTISTSVMSQRIGAGTLSPKPKHVKTDVDGATLYYKAEYIIIRTSNIQSQKHYLAAGPNVFFEVAAEVLGISQDQDNHEPFKIWWSKMASGGRNNICDQSYPESYNKMLTQISPFSTVFIAKHTG